MIKLIATTSCITLSLLSNAYAVECKDYDNKSFTVKPKTITVYNNSETVIYPVISTSKNAVNEWIQGCLRTSSPYPTEKVYKLYVNEDQGIAPGSSVTITLPLFSQIANGKYITWWNGGRVVLADKSENLRDSGDQRLSAKTEGVSCSGKGTACTLTIYSSDTQFPENIYAQLSEFTFGDSIIPPGQSVRLLKPENVGYNISYVDHVYLPIAIGPKNNPYIGYSGSTQLLSDFRNHLEQFLNTDIGNGWPVYNLDELKLPGGYNIFAQRFGTLPPTDNAPVKPKDGFPPVLTVKKCQDKSKGDQCSEEEKKSLHFGQAVQRIQNLWGSCVTWDEDISQYVKEQVNCPEELQKKFDLVQRFFKQNHNQYVALFNAGQCKMDSNVTKPVPFNYWEAMKHIYGWVPFNEGCGAAANPLASTAKVDGKGHAEIQSMYIHELQYNYQGTTDNSFLFNPYVKLIHAPDYLAMDAYGFSVDDAVGFMSELGDGLIFTVGGPGGLENKHQFNYADGFSVAMGVPQVMVNNISTPLLKKYGVCTFNQAADNLSCSTVNQNVIMPGNSQIAGFRVGNVASYPIKVSFTDINDNVYTFVVNAKFDKCPDSANPSQCPFNKSEIVDKASCTVVDKRGQKHPKSSQWCNGANPNQSREKQITKNFISFPQPVDYMN
ncbi:hypothetical protein DIZ81_04760 [Legionella taurinensis]|uniref:Uncharacterized protein n=1 Tax=Legionella taurinensis TaxID=70611 RepID=A0AB38N5W9_9GAMM|nr:hypothetical protein [Legionella taurinensis]MDX1836982.1 hypothetical protein [Legionella taurinensis]PUT41390.1 hypothetical protein DB744_04760 [Legionella taurinensis]PUT42629.1 hypothetical protein DB746_07095 [Legionella taurinensis]PUT46657.1 hypothetical protein DB743_04495 [Legionella taurinensis]PUT47306.1 hypothetical protein DB745_08175 [Legionella taurinensis]